MSILGRSTRYAMGKRPRIRCLFAFSNLRISDISGQPEMRTHLSFLEVDNSRNSRIVAYLRILIVTTEQEQYSSSLVEALNQHYFAQRKPFTSIRLKVLRSTCDHTT